MKNVLKIFLIVFLFSFTNLIELKEESFVDALGFSLSEANNALVDIDSSLPVEERIKLALKKR